MKRYYVPLRNVRRPAGRTANLPLNRFHCSGYTLVEILISISTMLILTGMAFGSFSIYRDFETVSDINDLLADLQYSRTEALKRQATITLCRSDDGLNCHHDNNWENGWIIFTDPNRNRIVDENDEILRVSDGLGHVGSLTLGSGYYNYIMFANTGTAYPRNTFKLCRPGSKPRAIILFATGRARVSREDSSGKSLVCA